MSKICGSCNEIKENNEFSKCHRNTSSLNGVAGLNWRCKACDKKWRENNIEYVRKKLAEKRKRYKESAEIREAEKQRVYAWREKKFGEAKRQKQARKQKKLVEAFKKRLKNQYRQEHITPYIKRMRSYLWTSFKVGKYCVNTDFMDSIGCDFEYLKVHIENQFKTGMTWENKKEWHIDHIIPFRSVNTLYEIKKLCHYTNIQPLWEDEHKAKTYKNRNISKDSH